MIESLIIMEKDSFLMEMLSIYSNRKKAHAIQSTIGVVMELRLPEAQFSLNVNSQLQTVPQSMIIIWVT